MQIPLSSKEDAIAYFIENNAILDKSGTNCSNTYCTSGRNGYVKDIPCPGKLIRVNPSDPSNVDYSKYYRWDGCLCKENKDRRACVGVSRDSFFEGSHVPTHLILLFLLLWIAGAKHTTICIVTGLCNETVTFWMRNLLAAIQWDVLNDPDGQIIGGPGIQVQVDESKVHS